jgi:LPXTG-site transpeptidase (sortase) family protein
MRRSSGLIPLLTLLWLGLTIEPSAAASVSNTTTTPTRLVIPAIRLDQRLAHVGLDHQGKPIVPKHDVGWYIHSARPGQGENVVMWGHTLRWKATPRIPAAFERLSELKPGTAITVELANGQARRYTVARQVWARPHEVHYILPVGSERLTLVTCIGKNVILNGALTKEYRLITIAVPAR